MGWVCSTTSVHPVLLKVKADDQSKPAGFFLCINTSQLLASITLLSVGRWAALSQQLVMKSVSHWQLCSRWICRFPKLWFHSGVFEIFTLTHQYASWICHVFHPHPLCPLTNSTHSVNFSQVVSVALTSPPIKKKQKTKDILLVWITALPKKNKASAFCSVA